MMIVTEEADMQRKSFGAMACPIARGLERVGEWWSMLILRDAFAGIARFDDFQEQPRHRADHADATAGCAGRERAPGAPTLQRAAAAGRVSADGARGGFRAGADRDAGLGQPAFRARGGDHAGSSTAGPADLPIRFWSTGPPAARCRRPTTCSLAGPAATAGTRRRLARGSRLLAAREPDGAVP